MYDGIDNPGSSSAEASSDHPPLDQITFAHESERAAAEILDFYRVRWQYEPRSFPITWNSDGEPASYFTPDFYLPEFDVYIELTTMSQKLVTKKNRKVRLLRELYPDVNIKIFYQKDFRALLARFGLTSESQSHRTGGGFTSSSGNESEHSL